MTEGGPGSSHGRRTDMAHHLNVGDIAKFGHRMIA